MAMYYLKKMLDTFADGICESRVEFCSLACEFVSVSGWWIRCGAMQITTMLS